MDNIILDKIYKTGHEPQ